MPLSLLSLLALDLSSRWVLAVEQVGPSESWEGSGAVGCVCVCVCVNTREREGVSACPQGTQGKAAEA